MINVAWQLFHTEEWIGGLNYFRNLIEALFSLEDRKVEPVLLQSNPSLASVFNSCRTLPAQQVPKGIYGKILRRFGKLRRMFIDDGGAFSRYLKENGIDLFSHGDPLGVRSPIPSISWLPDFQHIHLPEFFSQRELRKRDAAYRNVIERSQALLFSSQDARNDCNAFMPGFEHKAHVLHFVASVSSSTLPEPSEVLAKHRIDRPFFHVPNQLWAHKNHGIIRDALHILKSRRESPLVICTGLKKDYRNPQYFPQLQKSVDDLNLTENLRFLGLIPYDEMQVLLRQSMAMINPSRFEGWSSTVEEGKSLGKRILLSDIAVHREQAPERGTFFPVDSPEALAEQIDSVCSSHDEEEERLASELAADKLPGRMKEFARQYEEIVEQTVVRHNRAK